MISFFINDDQPKQKITSGFKSLIHLILSNELISSTYKQGIPLEMHNGFKSTKSLLKDEDSLVTAPIKFTFKPISFSRDRNENLTVPINTALIGETP